MMTRFASLAAVAALLVTTTAYASDPAVTCESGKLKISAKYISCLLTAESKAAKTGGSPDTSTCGAKFSDKWLSIETKAAGQCPSMDDQSAMQAMLDASVQSIAETLSAAGPCESTKLQTSGKYISCLLTAESKAVKTGGVPDTSTCGAKFSAKWLSIETKGAGQCPSDQSSVQDIIEASSQSVAATLSGGGLSGPSSLCGNSVIDPGEDCEVSSPCASGKTCTDRCFCVNAKCPEAIEWTTKAGLGTTTERDLGFAGLSHNSDVDDSTRLVLSVSDVTGTAPTCAVATIGGVNPRGGNCRCADNNRLACDEPFVADQDDCGGDICACYLGPPEPTSTLASTLCLVERLSADITGTWNVDTGDARLFVPQRTVVYLGINLLTACPTCESDAVANDGVRGGTCAGGPADGLPCDANGADATFPAPGGGSYSYDCFPAPGTNVSGGGIISNHMRTTGSASLPNPHLSCSFGSDLCTCGECTGDSSIPCSSDADCTGAGTCSAQSGDANSCFDQTCTPDGDGEGTCSAGPNASFCDGVLRASGAGLIPCSSNEGCGMAYYGMDVGNCTIVEPRKCFLDTIEEVGSADTSHPVLASAYCAARTSNGLLNTAFGLPGPVKTRLEGSTVFPCAGNAGSNYPGCP